MITQPYAVKQPSNLFETPMSRPPTFTAPDPADRRAKKVRVAMIKTNKASERSKVVNTYAREEMELEVAAITAEGQWGDRRVTERMDDLMVVGTIVPLPEHTYVVSATCLRCFPESGWTVLAPIRTVADGDGPLPAPIRRHCPHVKVMQAAVPVVEARAERPVWQALETPEALPAPEFTHRGDAGGSAAPGARRALAACGEMYPVGVPATGGKCSRCF